jgi:hypothetical protein
MPTDDLEYADVYHFYDVEGESAPAALEDFLRAQAPLVELTVKVKASQLILVTRWPGGRIIESGHSFPAKVVTLCEDLIRQQEEEAHRVELHEFVLAWLRGLPLRDPAAIIQFLDRVMFELGLYEPWELQLLDEDGTLVSVPEPRGSAAYEIEESPMPGQATVLLEARGWVRLPAGLHRVEEIEIHGFPRDVHGDVVLAMDGLDGDALIELIKDSDRRVFRMGVDDPDEFFDPDPEEP